MINQKQQIFEPASEEEASEILQECSRNGRTVKIVGGGTKLDLGNPYAETDIIISTLKLNKLIDYQPEDLTITVGAGMTFARLQEILAEQGQMLPLDPPDLAGQTLGGVLATNRSGPRRLLYGTARDLLIGCRFVLADGNIGHSGGRVVKNVAGYDLHKLFIGSYGTLGLLTEVTFKVVPLPQRVGVGVATFTSAETAFQAARQCVRSNLMPSALEVSKIVSTLRHPYSEPNYNNYVLSFQAEGTEVAVRGQLAGLEEICTVAGAISVKIFDESSVFQELIKYSEELRENQELIENSEEIRRWLENALTSPLSFEKTSVIVKASSVLTDLPGICQHLEAVILEGYLLLGNQGRGGRIVARAGTGIVYLSAEVRNTNSQYIQNLAILIEKARAEIQKMGGSLVIERAPLELKKLVDAWGDFGDALPSMQALKKKLDPQGLLNPGVMDLK